MLGPAQSRVNPPRKHRKQEVRCEQPPNLLVTDFLCDLRGAVAKGFPVDNQQEKVYVPVVYQKERAWPLRVVKSFKAPWT